MSSIIFVLLNFFHPLQSLTKAGDTVQFFSILVKRLNIKVSKTIENIVLPGRNLWGIPLSDAIQIRKHEVTELCGILKQYFKIKCANSLMSKHQQI